MAFFERRKLSHLNYCMHTHSSTRYYSCFYYIYQTKLTEAVTVYEEKIEQLNLELYALKRQAYVPKDDIPFGSILKRICSM